GAAAERRMGIATGLVVIGDEPVTGEAKEPTAVGETPDLAGRLQNAAKAGGVVVAETTRRLVGGLFDYHDLGHLPAEGLAEPMRAWQVIGPSSMRRCALAPRLSLAAKRSWSCCCAAGGKRRLATALSFWCRASRVLASRASPWP